jgi:phosphinothricin acetyltransferase
MNITIRYASSEDAEAVTHLYNYYIKHSVATFDLEPRSIEDRLAWIGEHTPGSSHTLLVAIDEDTSALAGYAATSAFRPKAAYDTSAETSIYIDHEYTGRGIGRELYRRLFELLETTDLHRLYACLVVPNEASFRLHAEFGFTLVGTFTEAGYKHGAFHDIHWLEKRL